MKLFESRFKDYLNEAKLGMGTENYKKFLEYSKGLVDLVSSMEDGEMKSQLSDAVSQTLKVVKSHYGEEANLMTMRDFIKDVRGHKLNMEDVEDFALSEDNFDLYKLPDTQEEVEQQHEEVGGDYITMLTHYYDEYNDGNYIGNLESFIEAARNVKRNTILLDYLERFSKGTEDKNIISVFEIYGRPVMAYYDAEEDLGDYEYLD